MANWQPHLNHCAYLILCLESLRHRDPGVNGGGYSQARYSPLHWHRAGQNAGESLHRRKLPDHLPQAIISVVNGGKLTVRHGRDDAGPSSMRMVNEPSASEVGIAISPCIVPSSARTTSPLNSPVFQGRNFNPYAANGAPQPRSIKLPQQGFPAQDFPGRASGLSAHATALCRPMSGITISYLFDNTGHCDQWLRADDKNAPEPRRGRGHPDPLLIGMATEL